MNNEPEFVPIPADKLGVSTDLKPIFGAVPIQNARVATFPDEPTESPVPSVVSIEELSTPAARYPGAGRLMTQLTSGLTATDEERLTALEKRLAEIEGMGAAEIQLALKEGDAHFDRINATLANQNGLNLGFIRGIDSLRSDLTKLREEMTRGADLEARLFTVEKWIREQNTNPYTESSV